MKVGKFCWWRGFLSRNMARSSKAKSSSRNWVRGARSKRINTVEVHLYKFTGQTRCIYSDRNQQLPGKAMEELTGKVQLWGNFWGDGNILFLDQDGGYTVCTFVRTHDALKKIGTWAPYCITIVNISSLFSLGFQASLIWQMHSPWPFWFILCPFFVIFSPFLNMNVLS